MIIRQNLNSVTSLIQKGQQKRAGEEETCRELDLKVLEKERETSL